MQKLLEKLNIAVKSRKFQPSQKIQKLGLHFFLLLFIRTIPKRQKFITQQLREEAESGKAQAGNFVFKNFNYHFCHL
jgi:hypothetical protein